MNLKIELTKVNSKSLSYSIIYPQCRCRINNVAGKIFHLEEELLLKDLLDDRIDLLKDLVAVEVAVTTNFILILHQANSINMEVCYSRSMLFMKKKERIGFLVHE